MRNLQRRIAPTRRSKPRQNKQTATADHTLSELKVSIDLPTERIAGIVRSSLLPETRPASGHRSQVKVSSQGRVLHLEITAGDLVALRAAANSFLRLAAIAVKTVETVAPFYSAKRRGAGRDKGQV